MTDALLEATFQRIAERAHARAQQAPAKQPAKKRGPQRRRTHCKRGHEWTPENTYVNPGNTAIRACRKCMAVRNHKRYV